MRRIVVLVFLFLACTLFCGVRSFAQAPSTSTPGQPELFLQIGHGGDVAAIAFSTDGKLIATGGIDATIKLWDVKSGSLLRTIVAPSDVTSVAFSPDSTLLASSGHGRNVFEIWNTQTGGLLRTFSGHEGFVYSLAFSPDGKTIASGSADKTVRLWIVDNGQALRTLSGHENIVNSVAFSPDGSRLASAGMDNTIRLWNVSDGTLLSTLTGGHANGVYCTDFSPDGKFLVSSGGDYANKGEVVLWNAASGQVLRRFEGHVKLVASVAFSPDGKTIASGSWDKTFKLWEAGSGQLLRSISATGDVTRTTGIKGRLLVWYPVAFSPDGQALAVAARNRAVRLWNVADGNLLRTFGGRKGQVYDAAFSPDGNTIAAACDYGDVKLWDAGTGELKSTLNNGGERIVYSLAFAPNGRLISSGGQSGTVNLWSIENGHLLRTFKTRCDYMVPAVAFSPDGKTIAAVSWDGASQNSTIELWNADTANLLRTVAVPENATVYDIAFSPDGKTIASGSRDRVIRLWNTQSGEMLRTFVGHEGFVYHLAFSPDGHTLASESSDRTLRLWNVNRGELQSTLELPEEANMPVAFSQDSRQLVSGGRTTISVWDIATGQKVSTLTGHEDTVTTVVFSPDGQRLCSGSWDTTLRFWDLSNNRLLATMLPMPQIEDATLDARPLEIGAKAIEMGAKAADLAGNEWFIATPEGYFDCSANAAKFIKWRVNNRLYPAERYYRRFRRPDFVQKSLHGEKIKAPHLTGEDIPPTAQFVSLKYSGSATTAQNEVLTTLEVRGRRDIKEVFLLVNGRPLPPSGEKPVQISDAPLNFPSRPIEAGAKPLEIGSKAIEIGAKPIEVGAKPGSGSTPALETAYKIAKRYTFRVALPVGARQIRVRAVAYDVGELGSTPTEILLQNPTARPVAGRLYAVCIGLSRYARGKASTQAMPVKGEITNLKYPAIDARSLAERLHKEGAPLYEKVEIKTLTDEQATLTNIRAALTWLQQSVRPGQVDTAVLCLSGHGISDEQGHYYFPTYEFDPNKFRETSLSGSELQEELGGKLRAREVFLFVDTCHSGALAGARSDDLNFQVNASGVYMMASSAASQYSYESPEWGHGAFTYALLRSLANRELARDGIIHFNVLTYAVPDEIARLLRAAGQNEDAMAPVVPLEGRYLDAPVAQAQ